MMANVSELRINYLKELFQVLNIGEVTEIEEFKQRTISRTSKFLIRADIGKFLVKFYENTNPPKFLNFIEFLNSRDFPTNTLITKEPLISPEGIPTLIYSYIKGRTKSFLNDNDLGKTSQLIARLHSESDLFYGRSQQSQSGLTHGDVNLTNMVFTENGKLFLIDFDKIKYREYISDVANFLFFNSLSDLSYTSLYPDSIRHRGSNFIRSYEDARKIKLNNEQIFQALTYQSKQFIKHTRKEVRERRISEDTAKRREILANKINCLFH